MTDPEAERADAEKFFETLERLGVPEGELQVLVRLTELVRVIYDQMANDDNKSPIPDLSNEMMGSFIKSQYTEGQATLDTMSKEELFLVAMWFGIDVGYRYATEED